MMVKLEKSLQYFNYFLMCFPFFLCGYPRCPAKSLSVSHLFASVLQDKTLLTVPEMPVPSWPASPHLTHLPPLLITAPLPWWKSHDVYGSFLLDGFQIPPFFFFCLCFFFFSLSLNVSVNSWWGEWSWSRGWGVEVGAVRDFFVCWNDTWLVRWSVCFPVWAEIWNATVVQRSPPVHIFSWLLHIIHSSQLLFQPLWVAELSSRSWIGVIRQRFPTFFGLWPRI